MDIIMSILLGCTVLLIVGLLIWIIYEIVIAIYHKTLRYETFPSSAKVCNAKYEEEYTTWIYSGKTMIPQFHDEEFNVYLMYEGKEYCFDDEELYNSVNIGDIIPVLVHKGYNKKNELKHIYLSI